MTRSLGTGLLVACAAALTTCWSLDEATCAVGLLPLLAAGVGLCRGRAWGALLALAGGVFQLLVSLPAAREHPFVLAPGALGLVVFALSARRLWRVGRGASLLAAALALLLGGGLWLGGGAVAGLAAGYPASPRGWQELDESVWEWQGRRDAREDAERGWLLLRGMGMGGGLVGLDEALHDYGASVQLISESCFVPRQAERWFAYNQEAERILEARHGKGLFNRLWRESSERGLVARLQLPVAMEAGEARGPASVDELLRRGDLLHADPARVGEALRPVLGSGVRWRLHSWGGEVSGRGYLTPSGVQPEQLGEITVGRVRLISPTLGADADLEAVDRAGHPVIACLALFGAGDRFVRSDGLRLPTPKQGASVTIEARLWGVTSEGEGESRGAVIWLHDCAVR